MPPFQCFTSSRAFQPLLVPLAALFLSSAIAQQTALQPPAVKSDPLETHSSSPAPSATLARGPGSARVSAADVLSELRRAPAADRQTILAKPDMVRQIASNLLVRRVLAAEAERDGLGADPVVAATLAIARDHVLSDARLAQLDAQNTPSEAALDTYARSAYQANSPRFERPAQTRARHILLANTGPESLQKARALVAQLRAGASFEELAKANSTDSGSAARGGDLGFFAAGKMVRPFEDALGKLSKHGDLSDPVESQFGYHIIRLEERRDIGLQPYDEVRDQLLGEARAAIVKESRVQKAQVLSKDFVFEHEALEALVKSATP